MSWSVSAFADDLIDLSDPELRFAPPGSQPLDPEPFESAAAEESPSVLEPEALDASDVFALEGEDAAAAPDSPAVTRAAPEAEHEALAPALGLDEGLLADLAPRLRRMEPEPDAALGIVFEEPEPDAVAGAAEVTEAPTLPPLGSHVDGARRPAPELPPFDPKVGARPAPAPSGDAAAELAGDLDDPSVLRAPRRSPATGYSIVRGHTPEGDE